MVGAMHNVYDSDTQLDASSGSSGKLLFCVFCYISWSSSSPIKQEDDPGRTEVWCKVGDVVGSVVPFYLFWGEWCDLIFEIFLWEDRPRVGSSHIACWSGRHDPLLVWWDKPWPKGVVFWPCLGMLPFFALEWFQYSLVNGSLLSCGIGKPEG